jgi:hypothetical protein
MEMKTLINWRVLSEVLSGLPTKVRPNRVNKKHSKEIESLEKHLLAWAKENEIDIDKK